MAVKVLKECNPNRHGRVRLVEATDTSFETTAEYETLWFVQYPGVDEQEEDEYDNLASAQTAYDFTVERLAKTPNWEAQAEYDAEWGTDGGYAPWQFNREY